MPKYYPVQDAFGFRCTVEPISGPHPHPCPNGSLEHQFVWCLANACRMLAQKDNFDGCGAGEDGGERRKSATNSKMVRELLGQHGLLLRRGMHFGWTEGTVPSLGELIQKEHAEERREPAGPSRG